MYGALRWDALLRMIMAWPPRASGSVVDELWREWGLARGAGAHACVQTCAWRVLDRAFSNPINPPIDTATQGVDAVVVGMCERAHPAPRRRGTVEPRLTLTILCSRFTLPGK